MVGDRICPEIHCRNAFEYPGSVYLILERNTLVEAPTLLFSKMSSVQFWLARSLFQQASKCLERAQIRLKLLSGNTFPLKKKDPALNLILVLSSPSANSRTGRPVPKSTFKQDSEVWKFSIEKKVPRAKRDFGTFEPVY